MASRKQRDRADWLLTFANAGIEPMRTWVSTIHSDGVTDSLAKDLNAKLRKGPMPAVFHFDRRARTLRPMHSPLSEDVPDEVKAAYLLSEMICDGVLDQLKQCELPSRFQQLARKFPSLKPQIRSGRYDCSNYFLGNSKARWCSNRCGTKFRKAEAKEEAKRRQII